MDGPPAGLPCDGRTDLEDRNRHRCVLDIMCSEVHSGAPVESSCKPTSKANLSVSEREVVKQHKYCDVKRGRTS